MTTRTTKSRIAGGALFAALMLSTALALAPSASATMSAFAAQPAPALISESDAANAFFDAGYTYCDSTLLGALWKQDSWDAKIAAGRKILRGDAAAVPAALVEARRIDACEWGDTPHSYADAELLAVYWKLPEPYDAKLKVAKLYTEGRSAEVIAAIQAAGGSAGGVDEPAAEEIDQQDIAAFGNSQYTYCDAKLISELWSIGILDAKATIGYKLRNNYGDLIPPILAEARQSHSCDWVDTGLAYADAEKLAGIWKVSVDQAKTKAAAYYTAGESQIVLGALGRG